jgi:hypothetical protein
MSSPTSIYFHIHGTALFNPTYNNVVSKALTKICKIKAKFSHPSLQTSDTELKLLSLNDIIIPSACYHFRDIFENLVPNSENRYYVQWSGDIGMTAWEHTAAFIYHEIFKLHPNEQLLNVYIVAHSHGGQIARLLAHKLAAHQNIFLYIATIQTPLSRNPLLLMPTNVKTWQHFYHKKDVKARYGALLMQSEIDLGQRSLYSLAIFSAVAGFFKHWYYQSYVHRIEDLTTKLPLGHQSHEITFPLWDKHNGPLKNPACAKLISQTFLKAIYLHSTK